MAEETNKGPILFVDVSKEADQYQISVLAGGEPPRQQENENDNKVKPTADPYLRVQGTRIRCDLCKRYSAENEEIMQRHVRKVHRGENPFQCYMCDYSTYNKSLFEDHVRMHQGIKPFKCSHCPYRSVSKKNAKKHELIHRPNNPLRCPKCPFIARKTRDLKFHLKKHAETTSQLECPRCKSIFEDQNSLNEHTVSGCDNCESFLQKSKRASEKTGRSRKGKYKCKVCKWSASSKPRFLLHLIHHPDQDLSDCDVDLTVLRKYGILPSIEMVVADGVEG